MLRPPLKPCIVIFTVIAICFFTEFLQSVTRDKHAQSIKSCGSYDALWSYLWYVFICGVVYPLKFIVYQLIRGDYMEKFLCRTFNTIITREWESIVQKEKVHGQVRVNFDLEVAAENGMFQSFMFSGVEGMMLLIERLILFLMPRIFSYFFVVRSARNQLDVVICLAIMSMVVISFSTNVVIVYIMMHYRRMYIISLAQLNNHVSECLNNHLLVTYCHKETDEYKTYQTKVKKYKKGVIMFDVFSKILEILLYSITNILKFIVFYIIYKKHSKYPQDIVITAMQYINVIEENTKWFGSFYEKVRKSILQAEFAYNFVSHTTKTQQQTIIFSEDDHVGETDPESIDYSSTSEKCTIYRKYDKKDTENIHNYEDIKLNEPFDDIENVENRSRNRMQKSKVFIKFVEFAVVMNQRLLFTPINLIVNRNEKILIKGANGIGKSSIIKVFFNMADYIGDIIINNAPLRDIEIVKISSMMSVCPQSSLMFRNTLRFNLGYGNSATDEEMMQMCERVDLIKDRNSTTLNLNDMVMSGGRNFSGGEQKKLCIARTSLKKCAIYWFDEPTAGLDRTGMNKIMAFLSNISSTVIIIMHGDDYDDYFDKIVHLQPV